MRPDVLCVATALIVTFALVTDAYSTATLPIFDRAKPSMYAERLYIGPF